MKQSLLEFLANPPPLGAGHHIAHALRADPRQHDFERLNCCHGGKKYIKMA